jgi:predicted restriction endonuclease
MSTQDPEAEQLLGKRRQGEARKIAHQAYPFRCCVICGQQMEVSLVVAHLDHHAGNNDLDNLAYLCGTHHWMYDCGLYPIEAVKLLPQSLAKDARQARSQAKNERRGGESGA